MLWGSTPPSFASMLRVAQVDRAPDRGSGGRRFKPAHAPHGTLAQLVERQTEDLRVSGSIPEGPAKKDRCVSKHGDPFSLPLVSCSGRCCVIKYESAKQEIGEVSAMFVFRGGGPGGLDPRTRKCRKHCGDRSLSSAEIEKPKEVLP